MKKIIKIIGLSILGLFFLLVIAAGLFVYKAKYGFNFYETSIPELPSNLGKKSILLFSKTNGFRHGEAIKASTPAFEKMAAENGWSLFICNSGAVFNESQLQKFKVVIWNNTSGKVLNTEQRSAFRNYLESGGGFVGLHASGDGSHQWEWYQDKVIGAKFSHHPLNPQFQKATMKIENTDSIVMDGLTPLWDREEEWYIFHDNPRKKGSNILYTVDETNINPSGNLRFLASDKDWGMGADHPIVWFHEVEAGRALYSALGHQGSAFEELNHLRMLQNGINWAGKFNEE